MPMKGKHTINFLQYQGVRCAAMSCGGESFSPAGAYDFAWDSVMPMKGKYTIIYIQYPLDVGCDHAAYVPAFLRERGGASVSIPQQSAPTSSCASEACTRSANCAKAGASTVQFFDVVYVPSVVR